MELFEILSDWQARNEALLTVEGKAFVNYLADLFENLNTLNKQL